MKVNNVSNTSFGIKCIKPEKWNKEVYETLVNSTLAKEIDKKYPKASANYFLYKENDMTNDEDIYTLLFNINLAKDKIWHFWLNSHNETALPQRLSEKLRQLTVEKLESEVADKSRCCYPIKIDIKLVEKNPIKRFFKKIFD